MRVILIDLFRYIARVYRTPTNKVIESASSKLCVTGIFTTEFHSYFYSSFVRDIHSFNMTLIEEVEKYFGTNNLYEAIETTKDANQSQIKKAYRKVSLVCHPDRVGESEKEEATKRFQVLAQIHYILSDEDKRKLYDDHGIIANEDGLESEADWVNYWRILFPKVTTEDINKFMDSYIGSEQEVEDLIRIYERCKGDMDKIYQIHMSYDEDRTTEQLKTLLEEGKITNYESFTNEPISKKEKRLRKVRKEAVHAEKLEKKMKKKEDNMGDLAALIQSRRQSSFDSMIAQMEQKYSSKESKKGIKRKRDDRRKL